MLHCLMLFCSRVKDGKILEVKNSSDRRVQNKEIIIPIQVSVFYPVEKCQKIPFIAALSVQSFFLFI